MQYKYLSQQNKGCTTDQSPEECSEMQMLASSQLGQLERDEQAGVGFLSKRWRRLLALGALVPCVLWPSLHPLALLRVLLVLIL